MPLVENTGARTRFGGVRPVYRDGRWTEDGVALTGDVYQATDDEVMRKAYKLRLVSEQAYPPMPGAAPRPMVVNVPPAPRRPEPDWVDVDLYRVGESELFELPNGETVEGRNAALDALGVEADGEDE